jgi:hypothetical protein
VSRSKAASASSNAAHTRNTNPLKLTTMKKLFITAALIMAFGLCCIAQEGKSNVTITRQGNTFVATKTTKEKPAKESTYCFACLDCV